ncbi:hypothetical protein ACJJTC_001393 [Scirpophaga incertulas]
MKQSLAQRGKFKVGTVRQRAYAQVSSLAERAASSRLLVPRYALPLKQPRDRSPLSKRCGAVNNRINISRHWLRAKEPAKEAVSTHGNGEERGGGRGGGQGGEQRALGGRVQRGGGLVQHQRGREARVQRRARRARSRREQKRQ